MMIRLQIDSLILDGLTVNKAQGPAVKAAVEAELTRLLSEGGLAPELTSRITVPRLRGGNIDAAGKAGPSSLGRQIAGAVYRGIGR